MPGQDYTFESVSTKHCDMSLADQLHVHVGEDYTKYMHMHMYMYIHVNIFDNPMTLILNKELARRMTGLKITSN